MSSDELAAENLVLKTKCEMLEKRLEECQNLCAALRRENDNDKQEHCALLDRVMTMLANYVEAHPPLPAQDEDEKKT